MLNYAAGDAAAFEQLYLQHKGGVYRYFLRHTSNVAVAEELHQDIWLKVIGARDSYQPSAKFTTWLYTLAHNHLVNHYRKHNKAELVELEGEEEARELENHRPEPMSNNLDSTRQLDKLVELVELLPGQQKEVFLLKHEAGLGLQEIAQLTKTSFEATKSRLRYAMNKLKQGMSSYGR